MQGIHLIFLVRPGNLRKYEDLLLGMEYIHKQNRSTRYHQCFSESPEKQQAEEQIQALEESIREQRKK